MVTLRYRIMRQITLSAKVSTNEINWRGREHSVGLILCDDGDSINLFIWSDLLEGRYGEGRNTVEMCLLWGFIWRTE